MVDDWCSCLRGAASDLQRARVWTNDGCVGLPTTSREQFSRERSAASTEDTMSATCKIRTHELRAGYARDTDESHSWRFISECNAARNKSSAAGASNIHLADLEVQHMRWSALGQPPLASPRDPHDPGCRTHTRNDRIHTTTGMHAHVPTQGKG